MITDRTQVKIIKAKETPFRSAICHYRKCQKSWLKGTILFICDLIDHLFRGVVISRPDCFGMLKIVDMGQPAWFVRMAAGDLHELWKSLPFYLPKIAFCRRNDSRIRVYSFIRMGRLTAKKRV